MILLPGCRCCDEECDPVWSGDFGCGVGAVDLLEKITVDWSAAWFDLQSGGGPWPGNGASLSLEMQDIYFPKQYDALEIANKDRAYWKHVAITQGENPNILVDWPPDGASLGWTNLNSSVDIDCVRNNLAFESRNSWGVSPLPDVLTSQTYFLESFNCGGSIEFLLEGLTNTFQFFLENEDVNKLLQGETVKPFISGRCGLNFTAFDCGFETQYYNFQTYETPSGLDGLTQRPQMKMDC